MQTPNGQPPFPPPVISHSKGSSMDFPHPVGHWCAPTTDGKISLTFVVPGDNCVGWMLDRQTAWKIAYALLAALAEDDGITLGS